MQPAETPQQNVVGRPAPHAIESTQLLDRRSIIQRKDAIPVEIACDNSATQFDDRSRLVPAEAEFSQWFRLERGEVFWSGEGVGGRTCSYDGYAELLGKPVEHLNAGGETELLTSNAVDQSFEQ